MAEQGRSDDNHCTMPDSTGPAALMTSAETVAHSARRTVTRRRDPLRPARDRFGRRRGTATGHFLLRHRSRASRGVFPASAWEAATRRLCASTGDTPTQPGQTRPPAGHSRINTPQTGRPTHTPPRPGEFLSEPMTADNVTACEASTAV